MTNPQRSKFLHRDVSEENDRSGLCDVPASQPAARQVLPFLKWPGGKRWLVSRFPDLLPDVKGTYIEAFLGSGAVFFHCRPPQALLADVNAELIGTYVAVRDDWQGVLRHLERHHEEHCRDYYYRVRTSVPQSPEARAARFIYLNRTCWNGLYRVNRAGEFNVPIGTKKKVILDSDDFASTAEALRAAELACDDFEPVIDRARQEDLVFADPPYTVSHGRNGFVKYNERLFSWSDQQRLARALGRAARRGVHVVATNAYHEALLALYGDEFVIRRVDRYSSIAASAAARQAYPEVLVLSRGIDGLQRSEECQIR